MGKRMKAKMTSTPKRLVSNGIIFMTERALKVISVPYRKNPRVQKRNK